MQQNNGLDKNQLIIFALFSMIIMGAMFYFQNKQTTEQQLKEAQNPTQGYPYGLPLEVGLERISLRA